MIKIAEAGRKRRIKSVKNFVLSDFFHQRHVSCEKTRIRSHLKHPPFIEMKNRNILCSRLTLFCCSDGDENAFGMLTRLVIRIINRKIK